MTMPNSSTSAYQLDRYIEKKPDKKAEQAKAKQIRLKAKRRKFAVRMAVFFLALFIVGLRCVRISDLHNSINEQTKLLNTIQMENEQTRLAIESMTDKTKIQQYAENELGLKKLTTGQIVYLNVTKENYMKNYAKSNNDNIASIKGFFVGFLEYLK